MPSKDFASESPSFNTNYMFGQPLSNTQHTDLIAEFETFKAQLTELAETNRQLQAMIWEMWSGERSEVIITPPKLTRTDEILRLDS